MNFMQTNLHIFLIILVKNDHVKLKMVAGNPEVKVIKPLINHVSMFSFFGTSQTLTLMN